MCVEDDIAFWDLHFIFNNTILAEMAWFMDGSQMFSLVEILAK